jgi:hypothetical protein
MALKGRLPEFNRIELNASPLGSTPIVSSTTVAPTVSSASAKTKALEIDWIVNGIVLSPTS